MEKYASQRLVKLAKPTASATFLYDEKYLFYYYWYISHLQVLRPKPVVHPWQS
ncbi:MAG: hypothetical protein Rpha_0025 [Candidatus Ruthia sp. Apha_13_S6]|nr:hypothetical protein [Candidatus Ruthia sp. Apha_13_S6]